MYILSLTVMEVAISTSDAVRDKNSQCRYIVERSGFA